jgi:hypothetical protein
MNTFEITIERKAEDSWPVVANYHQAGNLPVRKEGKLQIDEAILRGRPTPLSYGQALGQAIFRDKVRDAFVSALAAADEPLRVLLSVEDEPLRRLRWERLAAPFDGNWDFLALHQRTPFSLYLPSVTDRRTTYRPVARNALDETERRITVTVAQDR